MLFNHLFITRLSSGYTRNTSQSWICEDKAESFKAKYELVFLLYLLDSGEFIIINSTFISFYYPAKMHYINLIFLNL